LDAVSLGNGEIHQEALVTPTRLQVIHVAEGIAGDGTAVTHPKEDIDQGTSP
jgi:hypothetical protein